MGVVIPSGDPSWAAAIGIISRLREAGHQAYAVGGCVRDLLLGRPVHDIDCATDARPEDIEALFPRTVAVGRRFGVVVVLVPEGRTIEVATFRKDRPSRDGRHPDGIDPGTMQEDAERRDFTINALYLDPLDGTVIDLVGGGSDLEARRLRTVGDPQARFHEDRLRILRGLRFQAQLELTADTATWEALRSTSLGPLSDERLMQEWAKGLAGAHCGRWWGLLQESGRMAEFCPPVAGVRGAADTSQQALLERLPVTRPGPGPAPLAAAAWLLPAGPAVARAWLEGRRLPRAVIEETSWLLDHGCDPGAIMDLDLVGRRRRFRHPSAGDLAQLWTMRAAAVGPSPTGARSISAAARLAQEAWGREQAAGPLPRLLTAADLLAMGIPQGPRIGVVLRALEDAQLAGEVLDRDQALSWARPRVGPV